VKRAGVFLALLLISGCTGVTLTRVPTTLDLVRVLDLHLWWLPLPDGKQWTIGMADPQPLGTKTAGLLHAGGESLISMRPIDDRRYAFTIRHRASDTHGTIDVCAAANACAGQWHVRFFDTPRCNTDCSAYIAGEVTSDETHARRQIVLTLIDESSITP
jgi:hypothetical protein